MKLATLLKAIEPLNIFSLKAERKGQSAKNVETARDALCPIPYANLPDLEISSIHYRAQEAQPGGMFVAIEGQTADGHDFMHRALQKGAVAFVTQKEPPQPFLDACTARPAPNELIVIRVPDTRIALADLAAVFFNHPSAQMCLIGITGTNGKTTVA